MTEARDTPGQAEPADAAGDPHPAAVPEEPIPPPPSPFQHPQWMVGIVVILGGAAIYAGLFSDPVWLLIGSPFIAVILIVLWARLTR